MAPKRRKSSVEKVDECVKEVNEEKVGDFERYRLAHIRRSAEQLTSLGLLACAERAPKRLLVLPTAASLASSSAFGAAKRPRIGDAEEGTSCGSSGKVPASDPEEDESEQIVIKASQAWLCESRAALLQPGLGEGLPETPAAWRAEAVRRWGVSVPSEDRIPDWEQYVRSRLPTPPPPSPLDLMQERYASDIWRLLVSCTLMARISSERNKEETIATFFERFASPSFVLAGEDEVFRTILRPLGLLDTRIKTLLEVSRGFLEMPIFDCGHQKGVNKIWGCGAFSVDSYHLFCRGRRIPETMDATCQNYMGWWQTEAPTPGGSEDCNASSVVGLIDHCTDQVAAVAKSGEAQQTSLLKFFKVGA